LAYTIAYPAWPMLTQATEGVMGWTSRGQLLEEMSAADAARQGFREQLAAIDTVKLIDNPEIMQQAVAGGAAAFKVNCVQCHGSGAAGSKGYPNLNDDDWIWGGTVEDIHTTLLHGIRHVQDDDTRLSDMPAYGRDEILDPQQISDVAWYVRKISDQETDTVAAVRGEVVYADNCAVCHGEMGEGIRELGAPRLSDAIWLYGGEFDQIVSQIKLPKQGVMPAWGDRLNEATVKQLAVFVHSLGGGE
jgi:cytochrome c oxidase cbb3-type subunit 3